MQGRRRWIGYLALEATAVLFHLERNRAGSSFRDSYRDLAWMTARDGGAIGRIDLDFDYYERMANFGSSGAYDADPATAGVQPELDPTTYNGQVWELARGIYLRGVETPTASDPGYDAAVAYYQERSYGDDFLWNWGDRSEERTEFRGLIRESDEAFRTATVLLGVAVANHLVSAIDAFVSARGAALDLGDRLEFGMEPGLGSRRTGAVRWHVRIPVGR